MMNSKLMSFVKNNWLLVSVTACALVAVAWFGIHILLDFIYFHDPRNVDVALRGWMTPRYIVMTYDLPRHMVAEILDLPPEGGGGQRLRFIADNLGMTMEELTDHVRNAASQYRAQNQ